MSSIPLLNVSSNEKHNRTDLEKRQPMQLLDTLPALKTKGAAKRFGTWSGRRTFGSGMGAAIRSYPVRDDQC